MAEDRNDLVIRLHRPVDIPFSHISVFFQQRVKLIHDFMIIGFDIRKLADQRNIQPGPNIIGVFFLRPVCRIKVPADRCPSFSWFNDPLIKFPEDIYDLCLPG